MTNSDTESFKDIDPFFNPKRIALVGASADYRKLGNSILMNLLASEIDIYPITRSRDHVLGAKAYPNLAAIPEPVDLVIVAVAAKYCKGRKSSMLGKDARCFSRGTIISSKRFLGWALFYGCSRCGWQCFRL
jgi:predicted CoA-binding protein